MAGEITPAFTLMSVKTSPADILVAVGETYADRLAWMDGARIVANARRKATAPLRERLRPLIQKFNRALDEGKVDFDAREQIRILRGQMREAGRPYARVAGVILQQIRACDLRARECLKVAGRVVKPKLPDNVPLPEGVVVEE